jgi:predicted amidohydrolase
VRIAAAQISCSVGDVAANLKKIEEFTRAAHAKGAELIVFPEMADTGYSMEHIRRHAASWDQGAVPKLKALAADLSIAIVCGLSERDNALIYNSQVVIDRHGEVIAKYRKTHLFPMPPIAEHLCFAPGDCLADFSMAPFRFGLTICYDLRFPEVYRTLVTAHQANAFIISSAWPFPRVEHFRILAVARAIENQSYVIAANRVGMDDGVTCCGTSAIIDPYGVVVASASADREEVIYADLSGEAIKSVRERMPVFANRRAALYRLADSDANV